MSQKRGIEPRAETPSVSVILPTYQRRELVRRAVASVLAQGYRDFELIVIDDGSTDGTREALAGVDERIRYEWQPNRGVAAARNAGLRLARGRIVAFLDSDDRWLPEHLALLVEALDENPETVLAWSAQVSGDDRPPGGAGMGRHPFPRLLVGNFVGGPTGVGAHRNAVVNAGEFDERLRIAEDSDLWLRVALGGGKFDCVRRRTVIKGESADSVFSDRARGEYVDALESSTARLVSELEGRSGRLAASRLARVRGRQHFIDALRGLNEDDEERVRTALQDACRLLPPLSRHPKAVLNHLRFNLPEDCDVSERERQLARAAALWPDRDSDTARHLAARATDGLGRFRHG